MYYKPFCIVLLFALTGLAQAGVHYSGDTPNELPCAWRGFLLDLQALRLAGNPGSGGLRNSTPLRERYLNEALKLEEKQKKAELNADDSADLGALYLRLGTPDKALAILRTASRKHPEHFRLQSNLGTAWQLSGDLKQAALALDEALQLAPKEWHLAEGLQLKLVLHRAKRKSNDESLEPLFESFDKAKLPKNTLVLTQQLCLWLPNDAQVLWQLAEVANALGDVRTASSLMDGCVSDFGIKSLIARDRKKELQKAAEEFAKTEDHAKPFAGIEFRSTRVFPRRFDAKTLPKIDPVKANPLPWAALEETEVGKKFAVKFFPYVDELDGKTVSISGFMQPSKRDEVSEFAFTEFPVGCWFCEMPSPFQIVEVETKDGQEVPFQRGLVTVTGKLVLNRTEPERLLFRIVEAKVRLAE